MGDFQLNFYHGLPAPLRSVVASVRGYYLRGWRYGAQTEGWIEEAFEREKWGPERWSKWREGRLAEVLHRAATRVPFYREQWAERRRKGDRSSWEQIEHWPVLSKEALRAQPEAFVADDCDLRKMFRERTSGTSGKPLSLWWSRSTVQRWYALYEARIRRWNGVSRHDHWAILGGQPVVPPQAQKPPFWVWNSGMNQLYLSANHVSSRNAAAYLEAMERYAITHLVTYASSATALARERLEQGLSFRGLRVVITNAEPLLPDQRQLLSDGFSAAVRETYGMGEIVAAGSECHAGKLHQWPEVGHVEVFADGADEPAARGVSGRLVCTGLLNADMPLIRYAVGDRGAQPQAEATCACGRALPVFQGIEGRSNDLLITADGRRVFWLNPVFYGLPVCEAQIIQESRTRLRIRYVPARGFDHTTAQTIQERLRARLGEMQIMLDRMDLIPRGPNGKFRSVVNELTAAEQNEAGVSRARAAAGGVLN